MHKNICPVIYLGILNVSACISKNHKLTLSLLNSCEMNSVDGGIVVDETDEERIIEGRHDTMLQQSTPAVEMDSCSDVHVGTRLHYHGSVVFNQKFLNIAQENELRHRASAARVQQQFPNVKDKGTHKYHTFEARL
jgi:hypothetical protein